MEAEVRFLSIVTPPGDEIIDTKRRLVCTEPFRYHCSAPQRRSASPHGQSEVSMHRQTTFTPKPVDIQRDWFVVDASDRPLGRLASEIAKILRGKHKPIQAPHVDVGDYVVVVNAEKVKVSSDKGQQKVYYRHSGYPGGLSEETYESLINRRPEAVIERAVRGMLPKNPLGRSMARKLRVYVGPTHPHEGQAPRPLELDLPKVDT